jgi:ABC-2 type transport system permease protein
MNPVLVLFRKSLLIYFRNKAAVSITFVVPIVLIYIFGHVFGLYRKDRGGPVGIRVAVVNQSNDPAAVELIKALEEEKAFRLVTRFWPKKGPDRALTETDVRAALHDNDYDYAVIIPADLISEKAFGVHLKFLSDPRNEIEAQTVNGLLQKTIFSSVPQLLGQSLQLQAQRLIGKDRLASFNRATARAVADYFGGDPEKIYQQMAAGDFGFGSLNAAAPPASKADPTLRRLDTAGSASPSGNRSSATSDLLSKIFSIENEQVAGKSTSNPMAARLVGGYAIMFLLFAVSASAAAMFEEKRTGIYQRLLAAPVRPAHILWARFLFGVVLGLVQITALFIAGRIFYGLDLVPHLGTLFVLIVAAAAACTAFGMLVAAVAPTPEAANGISTLIVMVMSAIGGAWFPTSFMPEFIQRLSKLTLVYWAVEGFTSVLWAGQSFIEVLPSIAVLFGMSLGVMLLATWLFRRGPMFD